MSRMHRTTIVVAATFAMGACGGAPATTQATISDFYKPSEAAMTSYYHARVMHDPKVGSRRPIDVWADFVHNKIQANIASGPCPRVGEKAEARAGQVAATMANTLGGSTSTKDFVLIPTSKVKLSRQDSYIGANAFGMTRQVDVREGQYQAIAVRAEPGSLSSRVLEYSSFSRRVAAGAVRNDPEAARISKAETGGLTWWVSGGPIEPPAAHRATYLPTLNASVDATINWKVADAIELQCAALVDKSGIVVERLF